MQTSPPISRPALAASARRFALGTAAVIVAALALRAALAFGGGQQFWPDEDRFDLARTAARALQADHFHEVIATIFNGADHLLFKALAIIPAYAELVLKAPPWLPALFFAAVSTWVISLVGRVARAAGADEFESFLATLFAAATSSLFYYSRHFFPYDLSLGFFLIALIRSLRGPAGFRGSFIVGVWASLGFLAYNGYWMVGGVLLVVHTLTPPGGLTAILQRGTGAFLGLVAPLVATVALGRALGFDLVASYVTFSKTVFQGDYGIAWRFIAEYFWHAERALAVLWALVLATSLALLLARRASARLILWLATITLLYAAFVVPSDVIPRFTVCARHVRALAPFLCLLTAALLRMLWRRTGFVRVLLFTLTIGVVVQAGFNFTAPLRQVFPSKFRTQAAAFMPVAVARDLGPYRIVNAGFLHNPDWPWVNHPGDVTVFQRAHPFEFSPYLYEGYSEKARAAFRRKDLSMRVVRLAAGGPPFAGFPGTIKLTLRFPTVPLGLQAEPLISAGHTGLGDVLFILFDGPDRFRLGLDHWGYQAIYSEPIALDRTKPHTFTLTLGTLFAPTDPARPHRLHVLFDGVTVIDVPAEFHESPADSIAIGMNLIGASTAIPELTADILAVERLR